MRSIDMNIVVEMVDNIRNGYIRIKQTYSRMGLVGHVSFSNEVMEEALNNYDHQEEPSTKLDAARKIAKAGIDFISNIEKYSPPNIRKELPYEDIKNYSIHLSKYLEFDNDFVEIFSGDDVNNINSKGSHYVEVLKSIADEASKSLNKQARDLKNLVLKSDEKIADLEKDIDNIKKDLEDELVKTRSSYDDVMKEIDFKRNQIDEMLGHASGKVIAGDYEKSASEEKKAADNFRYASLGCMAIGISFLGASLVATLQDDFDWKKSIFRMILAFLISVPAAYLARESAKHRQQQYQHLQTSLDLKAITPYMASLPSDEQHKLKVSIAARIFSAKDFSYVGKDPYPLNTQEIIMALISRIESKEGLK